MKNITNKELQRMRDLMGNKTPINENKTISSIELIKKSPNGRYYGIIRETKKYYIKESNDGSNFDFIGGVANKIKNQFESYEQAVRRLNLMLEDTDVLTPDIIEEKKFVIKTKKKKKEEPKSDFGGGEDSGFGGEEKEEPKSDFGGEEEGGDFGAGEEGEEGSDFDFGGEEEGGDFGTEEETTEEDEDLDLEDDEEEDSIKAIQKMTGKLGQKLRDTEDVSTDMSKWVAKSVLSALDLESMDSEDKKDLIRTIKKKKEESSDEEFDFMDDTKIMSTPIMTYMSDNDMVDWNQLSDEEKSEIVNYPGDMEQPIMDWDEDVDIEDTDMCSHCNGLGHDDMTGEECEWCMGTGVEDMEDYMRDEDDMYGPGDDDIKAGEEILSDEDNCSYCGDRNQPYYEDETEMGNYPGMGDDWMSEPKTDFMSRFAKNVKRAGAVKGKKMDSHELDSHLHKIKNKLGGSDNVDIDGDKVVGNFGYVEVKPTGYVVHKEGTKFGKTFQFNELGKLHDYVRDMDEDYMDDPYMMPQPAPARPQTRPDTPTKPVKPDTDKPSPSKRPFTPPPHITPGEEPNPKAEYDDEYYYGPTEGMDYMEDEEPNYYGSFEPNKWFTPMDVEGSIEGPSYEYDEFEYPDYESFRSSEFGTDPENKWFAQGEKGKVWFDKYRDKFGPMKVRKKTTTDFDATSKMFDYMEDDSMEVCSACEGRGHEHGSIGFGRQQNPCITCAGTGMVPRMEMGGEVDEPYIDSSNPMGYEQGTSTLPKGMGHRFQYKEKFNFPFNIGENSKRNKRNIEEGGGGNDHYQAIDPNDPSGARDEHKPTNTKVTLNPTPPTRTPDGDEEEDYWRSMGMHSPSYYKIGKEEESEEEPETKEEPKTIGSKLKSFGKKILGLKEDHLNNKMVSYEQEMAYEDVEDMARQHGMDVELCHKDRAKDPEEQTIYLDLVKKGKVVSKIRINTAGDIEMGHMTGKVFKGEPVDSHSDFDEVLAEKGIKMMPQPAPARPQTRPDTDTPTKPAKPGTDKPSPSKRPFTPPPHITPGEEPNPKAGTKKRKSFSYMDEPKSITETVKVSKTQLFNSLDKKNLSNEKLNDLDYLIKLIDKVLDTEYDFVADNTETLAKEYIAKSKKS